MQKAATKRSTVILPRDYHATWKITAAQMGISMNEFALRALFSAFENLGATRQQFPVDPCNRNSQIDMFSGGRNAL